MKCKAKHAREVSLSSQRYLGFSKEPVNQDNFIFSEFIVKSNYVSLFMYLDTMVSVKT